MTVVNAREHLPLGNYRNCSLFNRVKLQLWNYLSLDGTVSLATALIICHLKLSAADN